MTGPESPAVQDMDRLREVAAEAEALRRGGPASDGRGWYRTAADRVECFAIAAAVLAAVLPVHRAQVLEEAATAITDNVRNEDWSKQDRGGFYGIAPKMAYVAGHDKAAALIRRLAASTPPTPPSATESAERATAVPEEAPTSQESPGAVYRTGRKVGRTIYRDDVLIGVMDTPELAALVVAAMNRAVPGETGTVERPFVPCELPLTDGWCARPIEHAGPCAPPGAVPGTGDDPQRSLALAAPPITNTPVSLQVERPAWNVTAWRDRDDIAWTWEDGRWYIQDGYLDAETCGPHYDLDDLRERHGPDLTPLDVDNVPALLAEHTKLRTERDEALAKRDQAAENAVAWMDQARHQAAERDALRQHILDIDAHATPYGDIPDEPGWVGTYLVTAGAVHRALGKIGHTAPNCAAEAELAKALEELDLTRQGMDAIQELRRAAEAQVLRLAETIRKVRSVRERVAKTPSPWSSQFDVGQSAALMNVLDDLDAALGDIPSPTAPEAALSRLDGAMHSIWLHGNWRWLTKNMTTPEKEATLAAVLRHDRAMKADEADLGGELLTEADWAWWREPAPVEPEEPTDA